MGQQHSGAQSGPKIADSTESRRSVVVLAPKRQGEVGRSFAYFDTKPRDEDEVTATAVPSVAGYLRCSSILQIMVAHRRGGGGGAKESNASTAFN